MIDIGIKHRVGKVGFAIEVPKENEFLELIVNLDGKLLNDLVNNYLTLIIFLILSNNDRIFHEFDL